MFQRSSGEIGSFRSYVRTRAVWNLGFRWFLTFGTFCSKRYYRLEHYVPNVVGGNRFVSFVRTYARGLELKVPKVTNVWNATFQRLRTFRTLCSKGRLGNSFVSRAHTRTHAHRKGTLSAVAILVQDEGSFFSLSSWISECRNV